MLANVLVIEDRAAIGLVFELALSGEGHHVEVARDGKSGLEAMYSRKPCVVILDLNMPGMSGREVVEIMRGDASLRDIPVIIVSGSIPSQENMPHESSYQAFIEKPFDIMDVTATVDKLVKPVDIVCA